MALFRKAYRELGDDRLMELVRAGDEAAFTAIYDRYAGRVLNYFHRMLWQDRALAQDHLQELFTKLARDPASYDPARPFRTWLFSVAHNMCKNAYRHHAVVQEAAGHLRHAPDREEATAGRALDHDLFRARLDAELDRLEPEHKTTFVMRFHQELPIKEIAAIMVCSEGTVKSRIFYTLKKLAERLKEFGPNAIADHGKA